MRSLGGDVSFTCPHLLSCNVSGCCLNIGESIVHTILIWFNTQQHHFNESLFAKCHLKRKHLWQICKSIDLRDRPLVFVSIFEVLDLSSWLVYMVDRQFVNGRESKHFLTKKLLGWIYLQDLCQEWRSPLKIERYGTILLNCSWLSDLINKIREAMFDVDSYDISGFCTKSDPDFSRNFMKPL